MSIPLRSSAADSTFLTRRQLLATALGAAGWMATKRCALAQAEARPAALGDGGTGRRDYPILVHHCHLAAQKLGRDTSGRPHVGTVGDLLETLAAVGAAGAVVFAPFVPQGGVDANEWLVRTIAPHPHLIGFATIDPKHPDAVRQLRAAAAMKLKGVKFHPPVMKTAIDDPACRPFYAAAEELRMPIAFHTGAHGWYLRHYLPLLLDDVAKDHPKLPILIEHLGGMALFDQALSVLMNNKPNTFAGYTMERGPAGRFPESGLRPEQIQTLRDVIGPARIVYGLGYPWNSDNLRTLRDDLAEIRGWGLSAEDEAKVLGGNLQRLLPG